MIAKLFSISLTILLSVAATSFEPPKDKRQRTPISSLTMLQQFALDGLETDSYFINQSPQLALDAFGLPNKILIHHDQAYCDIDQEQTSAEWVYEGFRITVPYLRDADTTSGEWVPGSYRSGTFIDKVIVDSQIVPLRFGIRVGVAASQVVSLLKLPESARKKERIHVLVSVSDLVWRDVELTFYFDSDDRVTRIEWATAPWH